MGPAIRVAVVDDPLPEEPGAGELVEVVRAGLMRQLSHQYTRGGNTLVVYLLDPDIETILRQPGVLAAEDADRILYAVRNEVGALPPTAQNPIVLTTSGILRSHVHTGRPVRRSSAVTLVGGSVTYIIPSTTIGDVSNLLRASI